MVRRLALFSLALVLRTTAAHAQTQVIGFEGLPFGEIPQGYAGMQWSTGFNLWSAIASSSDPGAFWRYSPSSGTANAFACESCALYLSALDGTFNLNSVYLTAASRFLSCINTTNVSAYRDGVEMYRMKLDPQCGSPVIQRYDLDWLDVDRVVISAVNGGAIVDDISVTATPEPGTMLLLGTGLAGMVGAVRRRRRSRAIA